ncbi:10395_t:CDS:1, partial [Paraglomus occultum]
MANAKAWFKLENTAWDEVSLEDVTNVANLKKAIKSEVAPELDAYAPGRLTLKATDKLDDASQAVELDARDSLLKVLGRLHIEVQDQSLVSVQNCFAENVWLFVYVPS